MTLATVEVRWFFAGALADEGDRVQRWFADLHGADAQAEGLDCEPWRTDDYLVVPPVVDLGLKFRNGRFEIKGRERIIGAHEFAAGVAGTVERWIKWSLEDAPTSKGLTEALGGEAGRFVAVAKQRALRRFAITPSGGMGMTPSGLAVPSGDDGESQGHFHLELTRLRLAEATADTHWTLGAEGFPPEPDIIDQFKTIVAVLLRDCPAPLALARSMSYPQWLVQARTGEGR